MAEMLTTAPEALGAPRLVTDLDEARRLLTRRRGFEETPLSERAREGILRVFGEELTAVQVVDRIVEAVRTEGDAAVARFTAAFDGRVPDVVEVPRETRALALAGLDPELQAALRISAEQIAAFHRKQLRTSWLEWNDEGALGQIVRPLDRVGLYVPGGQAVYPSTLLMTAVPAKVAGEEPSLMSFLNCNMPLVNPSDPMPNLAALPNVAVPLPVPKKMPPVPVLFSSRSALNTSEPE